MNLSNFDPELKVWRGPKQPPIYNVNIGLGNLILEVLKSTPDRITQVSADTGYEMTCSEMRWRTLKIANYLRNSGFVQGDIVGIVATNSDNLVPVVFACFTLGLPINTLAPVMIESDIIVTYSNTKPKIIFCDANIIEKVKSAMEKIKVIPKIITLINKIKGHDFVDDLLECDFNENDFV